MATKKTTTKKSASRKPTTGTKRAPGKKAQTRKTAAKTTKPAASAGGAKKLSALDAAAKVLAGSKEPLTTKQMIEAMAAKKLWTSPGGKTPHATLYSAIIREISTKGKDARFKKTERGKFTANG
jgi:HB1, ASXL, restriction endonuclease HTH domain